MGVKEPSREFPGHRAWVRRHQCSVVGCQHRLIEAAHYDGPVPYEDRGGMGLKDHDKWCFSLCVDHHAEYHRKGWRRFDRDHKLNTFEVANQFAKNSPHRHRWEEV